MDAGTGGRHLAEQPPDDGPSAHVPGDDNPGPPLDRPGPGRSDRRPRRAIPQDRWRRRGGGRGRAGGSVSPSTWDSAAQWFLSVQSAAGSWNYHRDEGSSETVSMTAAGVGSLLICDRQLAPYRTPVRTVSPLLVPFYSDNEKKKYQ